MRIRTAIKVRETRLFMIRIKRHVNPIVNKNNVNFPLFGDLRAFLAVYSLINLNLLNVFDQIRVFVS